MSALPIGETTNQLKKEQIKSKLLVFEKMGKPDYPGKNLLKQRTNKEPTNSTHTMASNPGIIIDPEPRWW